MTISLPKLNKSNSENFLNITISVNLTNSCRLLCDIKAKVYSCVDHVFGYNT